MTRNKEFYRDRGSLSWAFIFPILLIIGCALAFSDQDKTLLQIGYFPDKAEVPGLAAINSNYSKNISYSDLEKAKLRLRNHQLHAVVDTESKTIWVNNLATESQLIKQLLENTDHSFLLSEINGKPVRYVDWVIPGVLGMNIMFSALFGVGYVLVRYRKNGVLKRIHATPVSAFEFLAAQVASRLIIVVVASTVIFVGSDLALDLMVEGSRLNLLIVSIFGASSMISLGLLIACRTDSEELAGGILNAATWPMMFLSGIWFSMDDSPLYLQQLAQFLPLTHLVEAARDIMINGTGLIDVMDHIMIMLAFTVFSLFFASVFFRWHK
jgi:ABC-type multidrug transport system permease subunit